MKNKDKSIAKVIITGLIAMGLIPILIMLASSYHSTEQLLLKRTAQSRKAAVEMVLKSRDSLNVSATKALTGLIQQAVFKNDFNKEEIKQTISSAEIENDIMADTVFVMPNGQSVTNDKGSLVAKDPTTQAWYKGALAHKGSVYWTKPFFDSKTNSYVVFIAEAFSNSKGQTGVLAFNVLYDDVQAQLQKMAIGQTGNAMLVGSNGVVLAAKNQSLVNTNISQSELFKQIKQNKQKAGNILLKGKSAVETATYDNGDSDVNNGIFAVAQLKANELTPELQSLVISSLIISAVVLVIVIAVAVVVTQGVKRMIGTLIDYFGKAEQGNLLKINPQQLKNKNWFTKKINQFIWPLAHGNETQRLAFKYNNMIAAVGVLVQKVQKESDKVANGSDTLLDLSKQTAKAMEEVAQTITGIAEVTSSQAQETGESVSQLQELSQIIADMHTRIEQLNKQAEKADELNNENIGIAGSVGDGWSEELEKMKGTLEQVQTMDHKIQNITKIISVINEISQRTNLLALNASIEAASAGDAGKGFAVVATEIRKLSDQSKSSTKEIEEIVLQIRKQSTQMVTQTNASLKDSQRLTDILARASESTREVTDSTKQITEGIQVIHGASKKIEDVQGKILKNIENISASTEENAAGAEEVSANSEEVLATSEEFTNHVADLKNVAGVLKKDANRFDVKD
ncbi:MAG: methyl-accepting chemotaxis protein [Liquorilactobacillus satsumensis]|uniref:methyl-accepting chemotaxis protein n=1 Tax=Liquorilactobacillus satsumensis TaxID=259059 RepID=UPI0039E78EEB